MKNSNSRRYVKMTSGKKGGAPFVLLVIQLLALFLMMYSIYFFESSGGDAAGAGLERAYVGFLVTIPSFIFIQIANLFFLFKAKWHWGYKFLGGFGFIILSVFFWLIT